MKTEDELYEHIFQVEKEIEYWKNEMRRANPPEGYPIYCWNIVREYNSALKTMKWVLSSDAKFLL